MDELGKASMAAERELLAQGLAPRYRVGDPLGAGGCGVVWAAVRAQDGLAVAVKFLHQRFAGDQRLRVRFQREIEILARLRHPHVMGLVEAGHLGDRPFLVMPRVEGRDLDEVLEEGTPTPSDAMRWLAQVASAVETAHSLGVVHRDLKPANVMVDAAGDALVTDFGLASGAGFEELTRTGAYVGTPHYMAPEQFEGADPEASMDVYALATMAFRVLEGRRPFLAQDLGALVAAKVAPPDAAPRVAEVGGRGLEDLVLQALDPDPAARPLMIELRAQLARRLAPGVKLPPPPAAPPPPRPPSRVVRPAAPPSALASSPLPDAAERGASRRRVGLAGAALALVVGFLWPGRDPAAPEPPPPAAPPPLPSYTLGLDAGGLELRFQGPVGRRMVVRVESPGDEPRRVELGPDDLVADVGMARRPERLALVLEGETGETLARRELSLDLQRVEPPPEAGGWSGYPVRRGDVAWLARHAGGFDRLVERDGRLELMDSVDPAASGGRISWPVAAPGGGLVSLAFEGARTLLVHGSEALVAATLPGRWHPESRALPLGEDEVLLLPAGPGPGPGAKVLDTDSGVLTDLELTGGYAPGSSWAAVTPGFAYFLLRSLEHQGRLEVFRRTPDGLVPHATLSHSGGDRCHDFLSADPAPEQVAVAFGTRLFVVHGPTLPAGDHDLGAGTPAGIQVIDAGPWIPRTSGAPVAVLEEGVLWLASMAGVPDTAPTLMMEEFVLSRAELDDPTPRLREVYRDHQGGAASHVGTWAGFCRLQRDPATGLWIALFESDRAGENLLVLTDAGELRFEWRVDHGLHTARSRPLRLAHGMLLGEHGRDFWYLPLWLLEPR